MVVASLKVGSRISPSVLIAKLKAGSVDHQGSHKVSITTPTVKKAAVDVASVVVAKAKAAAEAATQRVLHNQHITILVGERTRTRMWDW